MTDTNSGLIWDFPTRAFHWTLVLAIATSFVSVKQDMMEVHFTSGGVVIFLILFRILWGIVGPETAQFHRFFPTWSRIKSWGNGGIGHSPWGALSVFVLLSAIGLQASLGLITDDEIYLTGPLRNYVSGSTAYAATKYHAQLSNVIVALICLHLVAIAFYVVIKRADILRVFWSGKRKGAARSIQPRPWYLALGSAGLAALPVFWIFS